jgi:phytanoyl-CoA hydroxylase
VRPTHAEVERYREQGYLVVADLYTPEECDALCRHARDVVEGRVPLAVGDRVWIEPAAEEQELVDETNRWDYLFKIGHHMYKTDAVFRELACHPRVVAVLRELIGPNVKCVQTMYLDKPRGLGVGQPYHQDSHYLRTDPETLLAVWVALDDADTENGCLHVIPRSQNEPVYPHETPVDPAQRKIYVEVHSARTRAEVAVPLPRGSGVFFPGRMLHRSGNNLTDRKRRAFVAHYASARSRWLWKDDLNHPFLLVCGREYPGCL